MMLFISLLHLILVPTFFTIINNFLAQLNFHQFSDHIYFLLPVFHYVANFSHSLTKFLIIKMSKWVMVMTVRPHTLLEISDENDETNIQLTSGLIYTTAMNHIL